MICPKCGWEIIKNAYDTELDHWLFEISTEMQERDIASGKIKAEAPSEERALKVKVGAYEKYHGRGYDLHITVSDDDRRWLLSQLRKDNQNSLEAELRVSPPSAQMISAPFIAETEEDQFTGLDKKYPRVGEVEGAAQSGYRAPSSVGLVLGIGLMSIPFIYSFARNAGWLK